MVLVELQVSPDECDGADNSAHGNNDVIVTQENVIKKPASPVLRTPAQIQQEKAALQQENAALTEEINRSARISSEVTPEIISEVQQLLQYFGIPFIVCPSEAEAQCAMLEQLKLTDGTITDDNDVFLFGGQRVYRRVCSKKSHMEMYNMSEIERELCLSRIKHLFLSPS